MNESNAFGISAEAVEAISEAAAAAGRAMEEIAEAFRKLAELAADSVADILEEIEKAADITGEEWLKARREPYSAKRRAAAAEVERVKRGRAQARTSRRPHSYLTEAKKCNRLARSDMTGRTGGTR